ncbi:MAG TPA: ABC transporter ATP-binding protein [Candidatus Thermoplasmatota archaeon]|nr:ABC transporter ATP-binding protein [Candidatus Thermoplasmatota archaeon]
MATLEIEHVRKSFGDKEVLRDVHFKVPSGDILALIGPSGCGKTTLFRMILGEVAPDAGRILVDGRDVTRVPQEERGVGIVYQGYALFPHFSVRENVAYGLRVRRIPRAQREAKVDEMLRLVQLEDRADAKPAVLSGGEKQRVALARALAVEPSILLLDEAFTALDATTRGEVVQEVRQVIKRFGVTTLLITHDQEEAFLFSRHVVVLHEGKVITQDLPEKVMTHPHPFVQDFVKMCLFHQAKVREREDGTTYVETEGGAEIPIHIPGVAVGDVVHVMVKKGTGTQSVEVWPRDRS